jgi:hypothetical protein
MTDDGLWFLFRFLLPFVAGAVGALLSVWLWERTRPWNRRVKGEYKETVLASGRVPPAEPFFPFSGVPRGARMTADEHGDILELMRSSSRHGLPPFKFCTTCKADPCECEANR